MSDIVLYSMTDVPSISEIGNIPNGPLGIIAQYAYSNLMYIRLFIEYNGNEDINITVNRLTEQLSSNRRISIKLYTRDSNKYSQEKAHTIMLIIPIHSNKFISFVESHSDINAWTASMNSIFWFVRDEKLYEFSIDVQSVKYDELSNNILESLSGITLDGVYLNIPKSLRNIISYRYNIKLHSGFINRTVLSINALESGCINIVYVNSNGVAIDVIACESTLQTSRGDKHCNDILTFPNISKVELQDTKVIITTDSGKSYKSKEINCKEAIIIPDNWILLKTQDDIWKIVFILRNYISIAKNIDIYRTPGIDGKCITVNPETIIHSESLTNMYHILTLTNGVSILAVII